MKLSENKPFVIMVGILLILMNIVFHFVAVPFALLFVASLFGVTVSYWNALLIIFVFYVVVKVVKNL